MEAGTRAQPATQPEWLTNTWRWQCKVSERRAPGQTVWNSLWELLRSRRASALPVPSRQFKSLQKLGQWLRRYKWCCITAPFCPAKSKVSPDHLLLGNERAFRSLQVMTQSDPVFNAAPQRKHSVSNQKHWSRKPLWTPAVESGRSLPEECFLSQDVICLSDARSQDLRALKRSPEILPRDAGRCGHLPVPCKERRWSGCGQNQASPSRYRQPHSPPVLQKSHPTADYLP